MENRLWERIKALGPSLGKVFWASSTLGTYKVGKNKAKRLKREQHQSFRGRN